MRLFAWCGVVLLWAAAASAQIDPKTAMLERAGWEALAAGQAHAAADSFRQALAADPKNGRLHLGASIAALREKRYENARDDADQALQLDETLNQAREVLGQARYRLGDVQGAIREYEALTARTPDNKDAVDTLNRWRREVELRDRMQDAIGSHFTVSFEGPEEADLADEALASLDRAYWRIGQALGTYPTAPVPVVLYTKEQFSDITQSPEWAAGAYDGVIRVPMRGALENVEELDRVLAHEFTHAVVHTLAGRNAPTWLNEGLAGAFEAENPDKAEQQVADKQLEMPLSDLQTSFGRFSGNDATVAYATSAIAVRRLLDEAGGFAVANLLRDLGEGVDFNAAFLHRFQYPFSQFSQFPPR